MDINTYFSLSSALGPATSSGSQTSSSTSSSSLFGPAAQLSLGQNTGTGVLGSVYAPTASTWQFDLTGALTSEIAGIPQQVRSEEQQAAEAQAVAAALNYIDLADYAQARNIAKQVLDENPTNPGAVEVLGLIALSEGDYDEATQHYLKAHALDPSAGYDQDATGARILKGSDDEVFSRANAMLRSPQQREEGIRLLVRLTDRSPDFTNARVAMADALLDSGDGNNGLMQYNSAIREAKPGELGMLHDRLADLVDAAPSGAFVRQLLGKVQIRMERFDEALQTLRTAVGLADDPIPYHRDLAKAHVGVGYERLARRDISGAMAAFEVAKEVSPTNPDVKAALAEGHVLRAEQHTQRRNYSAALADYRKAADLLETGGSPELRDRAAHSAYALGLKLKREREASGDEIDGEVLAFQVAYDLRSSNATYKRKLADARVALGDQHTAAGELKEAAHAYRRAHELYQYDATYKAKTIDAFVAWGDERLYNHNWDDAVDAYMQAFQVDQTNAVSKGKLAEAYNARGLDHLDWERWKDAALDFKNALLLFPDNPTYQDNYDQVKAYDPSWQES